MRNQKGLTNYKRIKMKNNNTYISRISNLLTSSICGNGTFNGRSNVDIVIS